MKNLKNITIAALLILGFLSFKFVEKTTFEFQYPKREKTKFTLKAEGFKKFTEEFRGEDYYYYGESKDKMICSVLYFKLNKGEQQQMVEPLGLTSPCIPWMHFSQNSKLRKYEKNSATWGKMEDDFMFRQNELEDVEGVKIHQKHMYAYGMFDKDLFVNIHLSKTSYTDADSTAMREIMKSLTMKK
jgi:hypothetical protein